MGKSSLRQLFFSITGPSECRFLYFTFILNSCTIDLYTLRNALCPVLKCYTKALQNGLMTLTEKSQNHHQLISKPNLLFFEALRRTKFILTLKHYVLLVFAVLSITFCSSALCPDLPVSAYAALWLNSFSGLQTVPQNLCAWALHIFFYYTLCYIDFCKETDQEWISLTDEIIRAVFLLLFIQFLVTGVFYNLHTMPLLAPSLAKCERNSDYLIDWRVPGKEISINHLIST